MDRPQCRVRRPRLEPLDDRCLLSAMTPAQVSHAYGLDAIKFSSGTKMIQGDGAGQTIAIVVAYHDPNLRGDLQTFDRAFGLADPKLTQIYTAGTPSDDGWAGEESLDTEWAHALAPAANIVVVEARSSSLDDLLSAVDKARNQPNVAVISMSWGTSEFSSESNDDSHFTTPADHKGITFIASSGDNSAYAGAQWPAVSANVVGVGGTSLYVNASDGYMGEAAWSQSGGGVSWFEAMPSYQKGLSDYQTRTTPDVAAVADPATGVLVFKTTPTTGQGGWYDFGGTSVSAPMWSAILAVVDQGRALSGRGTLNGKSQTLPAIYAISSNDFHDVVSGSNGYNATVGYDLATGRGTPKGPSLVHDLVAWGAPATNPDTNTGSDPNDSWQSSYWGWPWGNDWQRSLSGGRSTPGWFAIVSKPLIVAPNPAATPELAPSPAPDAIAMVPPLTDLPVATARSGSRPTAWLAAFDRALDTLA